MKKDPDQICDYLVIGGGSAGAVMAARLSDNPANKVILVEAGPEAKHIWVEVPLGVGKLLLGTKFLWQFWTNDQNAMKGQKIYWPRGKALGGSSTVNGMLWTRGDAEAYDHWAAQGCPGWSYKDVLPYFCRSETFEGPNSTQRGGRGPITVSTVNSQDPLTRGFVDACQQQGMSVNSDFNAGHQLGVSHLQFSIRNGRRCSTHKGYLAPIKKRPNLTILTEATAERVLFDGRRAIGAVVRHGEGLRTLKARQEVILCAGAIKTPQILEMSGVGQAERLKSLGIEVLHDSPDVGENLIDHVNMRATYRTSYTTTLNDVMGSKIKGAIEGLKYLTSRKGLLSFPTVTAHAMAYADHSDRNSLFKIQLSLTSGSDRYANEPGAGIDGFSGFNIGSFQLYPKSRGSVHATSADPHADPEMTANYFSDEYDRKLAVTQMRYIRSVAAQSAFKELIVEETRPSPEAADDEELLDYVLNTGQTCWHPVGSCRMGTDERAVVDTKLRVRGVEGLRIVDASIFPEITASNTNAPTIMVAERAADLITNKLG